MFSCSKCKKDHFFPIILDCNHTMCVSCYYSLKQKYPYKLAIYKCEMCGKPSLLNEVKEVMIDNEKMILDIPLDIKEKKGGLDSQLMDSI